MPLYHAPLSANQVFSLLADSVGPAVGQSAEGLPGFDAHSHSIDRAFRRSVTKNIVSPEFFRNGSVNQVSRKRPRNRE